MICKKRTNHITVRVQQTVGHLYLRFSTQNCYFPFFYRLLRKIAVKNEHSAGPPHKSPKNVMLTTWPKRARSKAADGANKGVANPSVAVDSNSYRTLVNIPQKPLKKNNLMVVFLSNGTSGFDPHPYTSTSY